jgi:hypothetical protein
MAPSTIFLDIDGCILFHLGKISKITQHYDTQQILSGVLEKLDEWEAKGYRIVLTTGRPESLREITEQTLTRHGIFFNKLIMDLGGGKRYLINDRKPSGTDTAFAINLDRNVGLKGVNIE